MKGTRKKIRNIVRIALGLVAGSLLSFGITEITVFAGNQTVNSMKQGQYRSAENSGERADFDESTETTYLDELLGEMDFSELDDFLKGIETDQKMETTVTFSNLITGLIEKGLLDFDYGLVLEWLKSIFFSEISKNREIMIEVILLALGFSLLRNFAGAFDHSYISELCFILVYSVLTILLLQSFQSLHEIVSTALNQSIDFMKLLIPAFCISMAFANGVHTSIGFYQVAFLVIYLIQWIFLNLLVPMVQIYVLLQMFNHFFGDEKFESFTELLKGAIEWGMKLSVVIVMGLNVVQNIISPAKDRLIGGSITKAAAMIPGIGNAFKGISDLLLGAGSVIKSCVGVAALLILLLIGAVPIVKILCMTFFYKLAAVFSEPVSDKRIVGCIQGVAEGGVLYSKLIGYGLLLFILTIALTAAASSYQG